MPSQSISLYNQLAKNKQFNKTINFDLKRIKRALKKLGNPQRKLKNIINKKANMSAKQKKLYLGKSLEKTLFKALKTVLLLTDGPTDRKVAYGVV